MYRYSFEAKLILTQNPNQRYYGEIKNELLSYKGVKARMSFKRETFAASRRFVAFMNIRGKTLCLYLPIDAAVFDGKYRLENVTADKKRFARLKVKSDRSAKYAAELITLLMESEKIEKDKSFVPVDYDKPSETILQMIRQGLIKSKKN